jgi:hypothetical protein
MSIPNVNKTRISVVTKPTNVSVSTVGIRGKAGETQDLTNYAILSGGNQFSGSQYISGNLYIEGNTVFGSTLLPAANGVSIGTQLNAFEDIFVRSASLHILSDNPGAPDTVISNIDGNLLISAGGMKLIGSSSFIAVTGSFEYLSGSFTHIGLQFNEGDIVTTGSLKVSGSTIQIGNNTQIGDNSLIGNTLLSGSVGVNGVFSFDNIDTDNTATQVLVWNGITKRVGKQSGASNLDGGAAASVYLSVTEELNGGGA